MRLFKQDFGTELYVTKYLPPYLRSYLAQFRAGILPLEVELGRFRGLRVEERICPMCTSGQVEDEIHFLFVCQCYFGLRNALLNNVILISDNYEFILKDLMNNQPKQLALYIYNAMIKRNNVSHRN